MKLSISSKDALDIVNLKKMEKESLAESNLKKNLQHIESEIKNSAEKELTSVVVSLPINPENDSGNKQFLITRNSDKEKVAFLRNGYYDSRVFDIIKDQGFKIDHCNSKKDSMSGVTHMKIEISWREEL